MSKFRDFWESLTKSRYTCHLEQELARTRAELRQWQDIVLTEKGLPNLNHTELRPLPHTKGKMLPSQWRDKLEQFTMPKEKADGD